MVVGQRGCTTLARCRAIADTGAVSYLAENAHAAGDRIDVADGQVGCLVRPHTGIVEKQQQGVVTSTLRCTSIWASKERIHFSLVEIGHHRSCSLLVRDAAQLGAPLDMFRAVLANESSQSMDSSQTLIPRRDAASATDFDI